MINLNLLPNEMICKIYNYCDSKTIRSLSMVDRRLKEAIFKTIKTLQIIPPYTFYQHHSLDTPKDILIKIIKRYSNLNKIIFSTTNSSGYKDRDVPYFRTLISYLKNTQPHPLNSVRKVYYYESCNYSLFGKFDGSEGKEFNQLFLDAIGQNRLEAIKIRTNIPVSELTGKEIQPILENSLSVKTFTFYGYQSNQKVTLDFSKLKNLRKVKLLCWKGESSTLESLKECDKLTKLVIENSRLFSNQIKPIFLNAHSWNLNYLSLKGIELQNDEELDGLTKRLPNLEYLETSLSSITDKGMQMIGRNCSHLRSLMFTNERITDSGLENLTQFTPKLEALYFDQAYQVTQEGVISIARNCNKLRSLVMIHNGKMDRSGINALIQNCHKLKVIGLTHNSTKVVIEDIVHLAINIPGLRMVELDWSDNISKEDIKSFYAMFPQIRKIPHKGSLNSKQMIEISL